ncbi:hypothetical protein [Candidatus Paracaedibacter symbiosus]|uniref:hypothetical protein n=1 Tax=Candidatus Paracaedibacter symbiosus TaxID=244582 RepID=UPI00068BFDA5|nr:hypothetical protein [Candidatus Paracaedibacter symbiosus]
MYTNLYLGVAFTLLLGTTSAYSQYQCPALPTPQEAATALINPDQWVDERGVHWDIYENPSAFFKGNGSNKYTDIKRAIQDAYFGGNGDIIPTDGFGVEVGAVSAGAFQLRSLNDMSVRVTGNNRRANRPLAGLPRGEVGKEACAYELKFPAALTRTDERQGDIWVRNGAGPDEFVLKVYLTAEEVQQPQPPVPAPQPQPPVPAPQPQPPVPAPQPQPPVQAPPPVQQPPVPAPQPQPPVPALQPQPPVPAPQPQPPVQVPQPPLNGVYSYHGQDWLFQDGIPITPL